MHAKMTYMIRLAPGFPSIFTRLANRCMTSLFLALLYSLSAWFYISVFVVEVLD